jgi:hypothetical protein
MLHDQLSDDAGAYLLIETKSGFQRYPYFDMTLYENINNRFYIVSAEILQLTNPGICIMVGFVYEFKS